MRYIVGLLGFPAGLALIVYRERVKRFTGDFEFAEKWFGPGGTYTALLIFGILFSIGSLMYMFGTLQLLLTGLFGPILGGQDS